MLKYLWTVTQDLFVAVTLVTLMHATLARLCGAKDRRLHAGVIVLGVAAAIALATVKGTSNRIVTSRWNHVIYIFVMGFTLLYLILTAIKGRREGGGGALIALSGAGLSATLIFYALPGVLLYPFNFNTMGEGYLSSYYMVRMAGWLLALILLLVYSRTLYLCALRIKPVGWVSGITGAGALIHAAYCFGRFFAPWVNRAKWLHWSVKYTDEAYGFIGDWMMFTANHAMLFIWIVAALAAAALVGNVIRTNASISGAECGCQAEIGSACSMAAAALATLYGLNIDQIEYAAEIAMEHHLGLTCDPVKGLVQIPCIERNAVAAMRAISAVNLSRFLYSTRKISFDEVVATMYRTGKDMQEEYRETSHGGLAQIYENRREETPL